MAKTLPAWKPYHSPFINNMPPSPLLHSTEKGPSLSTYGTIKGKLNPYFDFVLGLVLTKYPGLLAFLTDAVHTKFLMGFIFILTAIAQAQRKALCHLPHHQTQLHRTHVLNSLPSLSYPFLCILPMWAVLRGFRAWWGCKEQGMK